MDIETPNLIRFTTNNGYKIFSRKTKNFIFDKKFEDCFGWFENKQLPVKEIGKWGIIDENGNYIVSPQYDFI
jgi:hypothetical protein